MDDALTMTGRLLSPIAVLDLISPTFIRQENGSNSARNVRQREADTDVGQKAQSFVVDGRTPRPTILCLTGIFWYLHSEVNSRLWWLTLSTYPKSRRSHLLWEGHLMASVHSLEALKLSKLPL